MSSLEDPVQIITDWPIRLNCQQKSDSRGKVIWNNHPTCVLLTGALIFPPHQSPTTSTGIKYPRNEILALYLYVKTGIRRTARQCGSKLHHMLAFPNIKESLEARVPVPVLVRLGVLDAILTRYLEFDPRRHARDDDEDDDAATVISPSTPKASPPSSQTSSTKKAPSAPPPIAGLKPLSFRLTCGTESTKYVFGVNRTSSTGAHVPLSSLPSGTEAILESLSSGAPILEAHVSLPANFTPEAWTKISGELYIPDAGNIEYHTLSHIAGYAAPDTRGKCVPRHAGMFPIPVARSFFAEVLKIWNTEALRRTYVPDIRIVQRIGARKKSCKLGGDGTYCLAVIYSFSIAEQASDASIRLRAINVVNPEPADSDSSPSPSSSSSFTIPPSSFASPMYPLSYFQPTLPHDAPCPPLTKANVPTICSEPPPTLRRRQPLPGPPLLIPMPPLSMPTPKPDPRSLPLSWLRSQTTLRHNFILPPPDPASVIAVPTWATVSSLPDMEDFPPPSFPWRTADDVIGEGCKDVAMDYDAMEYYPPTPVPVPAMVYSPFVPDFSINHFHSPSHLMSESSSDLIPPIDNAANGYPPMSSRFHYHHHTEIASTSTITSHF